MLRFINVSEISRNMIPRVLRDKISIPLFIILTFAFSWTCWFLVPHFSHVALYIQLRVRPRHEISIRPLLLYLGNFIPGLVALALSIGLAGRAELTNLLKKLNPLRPRPRCYLFAILIPSVALFVGACLNILDTGTSIGLPASFLEWVKWLLTNLTLAPLWEELGWRAFLLPRLQATRTGFHASMLIALIWGIWHLPVKYFDFQDVAHSVSFLPFFSVFFVLVSGLSIILTWLYNISQGSIVPCIIFHGVFNAFSPYLIDAPAARDGIMPFVWASMSICLAAIFLLFLNGENLGGPSALPNFEQTQVRE
jgi:membrane protease YdiL (CAAX protease family)